MELQSSFSGTTIHTLNLASVPYILCSSSSLRSSTAISKHLTLFKTLTLPRNSQYWFPFLIRSLSSAAAAAAAQPVEDPATTPSVDSAVNPQWKAAIDFKSILENRSAVAENLKNRNSNANLN